MPTGVALGLAVAAFVAGFAWLAREASRGRARLGLAACLVLVTTPYLAVWYLAWAVPLAAAEEDATATAACLLPLRVSNAADDPGLAPIRVGGESTTTPSSERTTCQRRSRAESGHSAACEAGGRARRRGSSDASRSTATHCASREDRKAEDAAARGEMGPEAVRGADGDSRRDGRERALWPHGRGRDHVVSRVASSEPKGTWRQTGSGPSSDARASGEDHEGSGRGGRDAWNAALDAGVLRARHLRPGPGWLPRCSGSGSRTVSRVLGKEVQAEFGKRRTRRARGESKR